MTRTVHSETHPRDKVYLPCLLMAKKRYVGFKYETPDEVEPVFDAKGIETVRRDGVPAQAKMTEICLKSVGGLSQSSISPPKLIIHAAESCSVHKI